MPNEHYQSLFGLDGAELRDGVPGRRPGRGRADASRSSPTTTSPPCSPTSAATTWPRCSTPTRSATPSPTGPSVVFAYTVKGWGLPIAGNPRNHSALLSTEQIAALRTAQGLTEATEWDRVRPGHRRRPRASPRAPRLLKRPHAGTRAPGRSRSPAQVETRSPAKPTSTQEAFGRLVSAWRATPEVAPAPGDHRARTWRPRRTWPASSTSSASSPRPRCGTRRRRLRGALERVAVRAAHRARHLRDEPVPAARPARPGLATCRTSRCCRSGRCTTPSSAAAWTPSSTAPTPARAS